MHLELSCLKKDATRQDITETVFAAAKHHVDYVAVPGFWLSHAKELLTPSQSLVASVDFPNGNMLTETRIVAIINAAKRGAEVIDLVINIGNVTEREYAKIEKDVARCLTVCNDKGLVLRPVVDHRLISPEAMLHVCTFLSGIGCSFVVTSTNTVVDEWLDNLIVCHEIADECGIFPIMTTNNFVSKTEFDDCVSESSLFGFRFASIATLQHVFGV